MNKRLSDGNSEFDDELDWLAFRYLYDELDDPQRARFEKLMAQHQAARDALVRAVGLSEIITAAPLANAGDVTGNLVRESDRNWLVGIPHLVFAASIVLAVLTISWIWDFNPKYQNVPVRVVLNGEGRLADSWIGSLPAADEETTEDPVDENDLDPDIIDDDTASWMIAALAELNKTVNSSDEGRN